jgi:hypothetical protein
MSNVHGMQIECTFSCTRVALRLMLKARIPSLPERFIRPSRNSFFACEQVTQTGCLVNVICLCMYADAKWLSLRTTPGTFAAHLVPQVLKRIRDPGKYSGA